jgi:hypothetical protein
MYPEEIRRIIIQVLNLKKVQRMKQAAEAGGKSCHVTAMRTTNSIFRVITVIYDMAIH